MHLDEDVVLGVILMSEGRFVRLVIRLAIIRL